MLEPKVYYKNSLAKIVQILQKVIECFPERGEGKGLILTYLNRPLAKVFPYYWSFFSILVIFRRKLGVKVGPEVLTSGPFLFHKIWNPSNIFQTMFLFAIVLPLVKMLVILDHILESKSLKTFQKKSFRRCWLNTQIFENF